MGLDDGICVKRTVYTKNIPELKRFEDDWDEKHECDFSVTYWRKCYNIRHMIFNTIEGMDDDTYEQPLTKQDIENIIKGLQSFNADNWDDNGGSIWEWEDEEWSYLYKLKEDIKNLQILSELMDKYDLEVYFYDSY
jgi:hypothetical protein